MTEVKTVKIAKKQNAEEIVQEIAVIIQILIKMGFDEEVTNDRWVVAVLNHLGVTSPYGQPLSYMGYRQLMNRANQTRLRSFIEKISHEPVAHLLPF